MIKIDIPETFEMENNIQDGFQRHCNAFNY